MSRRSSDAALSSSQDLIERPFDVGADASSQAFIRSAKKGDESIRPTAMPLAWAPWTGIGRLWTGGPGRARRSLPLPPASAFRAPRSCSRPRPPRPPCARSPGGCLRGSGRRLWVELGVLLEAGGEALGHLGQGGLCFDGEGQQELGHERLFAGGAWAVPCLLAARQDMPGRLLQDHVGVGAADAEGGDAGAPRPAARLPLDFA